MAKHIIAISALALLTILSPTAPAKERPADKAKGAETHKAPPAVAADKVESAAGEELKPEAEAQTADAPRQAALVSRIVLKVASPETARAVIIKEAALLGGFPVSYDDGAMAVKVPPPQLSKLIAKVGEQGIVVERFFERADLTQAIAELEGRLKSKQEILGRLQAFLADSDAPATLEIEQSMTGLVSEMEQVRGQLRVLTDRAGWAVVDIAFQFRERDKVVYVDSPFDWLNGASLDAFLEEF